MRPTKKVSQPKRRYKHRGTQGRKKGGRFEEILIRSGDSAPGNPECKVERSNQHIKHDDAEDVIDGFVRTRAFEDDSPNDQESRNDQWPLQYAFHRLPQCAPATAPIAP